MRYEEDRKANGDNNAPIKDGDPWWFYWIEREQLQMDIFGREPRYAGKFNKLFLRGVKCKKIADTENHIRDNNDYGLCK